MQKNPSVKEELKFFQEGLTELILPEELEKKLAKAREEKRPLRIKYGADPTSKDLHLGHTVPLRKLRQLQQLGHTVVFIVGDFTARIGDPTQQVETRKMLTPQEVKANAATYQEQVFRILDRRKTEVVYNSVWFDEMSPQDFLILTSKYTVARLLERDDFHDRFEGNRPIALIEFLYPLFQGYDSVMVRSDAELGGTDQKFNLLVGRDFQRAYHQEPQIVMTLPIIEGTDGVQKMSKSLGNSIGIGDVPGDMFGKIMSIPDNLMIRYFRYLTDLGHDKVSELEKELGAGKIHPRNLKVNLAKEIVALYHDAARADEAHRDFDKLFRDKEIPEEIPEIVFHSSSLKNGKMDLIGLLVESKMTPSRSEARRQIEQGAVKVNNEKVKADCTEIFLSSGTVIQCGKRKFVKVKVQ